jgi:hypothetical protein
MDARTGTPDTPENVKPADFPVLVQMHYIKSALHRVIHADGFQGSITPQMGFQLSVFSERFPIPQRSTYKVNADGHLGDEVIEGRVVRDGVVREVEASMVMSVETARLLHAFIGAKLAEVDSILVQKQGNK